MAREVISDAELVSDLEYIRLTIQNLKLDSKKVVFLNLESFYNYIDKVNLMKNGYSSDIRDCLETIGSFIPMNVSETHLEMFMTAASKRDDKMIDDIDKFFDRITKINFLNSIYQSPGEESWKDILKVCRTMRDFYEEEALQAKKSMQSSYFSKFF